MALYNGRPLNGDRRSLNVGLVMAAPFPALYGSQLLVAQLAEGLASRGHRVHLIAYGADSEASLPGVVVHRIKRPWGCRVVSSGPHPGKLVLDLLLSRELYGVVRRERVDLIHAHNYEAGIVGLLVGRLTRCPVVYHGHSAMVDELPTYFASGLVRAAARPVGAWLDGNVPRRADYCIGVTEDLVRHLRSYGVTSDQVRCVLPAIDGSEEAIEVEEEAETLRKWRHRFGLVEGRTLLYAGNLDRYQNLEFLLSSFARLRAKLPTAMLVLVTHEGRRRRRRVASLELPGVRVLDVADVSTMQRLLQIADVVVCPRSEPTGFPMKLLNYMAAAKAIVACRGSAKLLEPDRTALIVPNGDEGGFSEAMFRLLCDPQERARLGAAARATAGQYFRRETMLERTEEVYRRVLAVAAGASVDTRVSAPRGPR